MLTFLLSHYFDIDLDDDEEEEAGEAAAAAGLNGDADAIANHSLDFVARIRLAANILRGYTQPIREAWINVWRMDGNHFFYLGFDSHGVSERATTECQILSWKGKNQNWYANFSTVYKNLNIVTNSIVWR